jgi:uncharacterized membrane protein
LRRSLCSLDLVVRTETPPELLVLVDSSESMDIRDTRKSTAELAEAGMAIGSVPFPESSRPEAMEQALAAMERSQTFLAEGRAGEARAARQQAAEALTRLQSQVHEDYAASRTTPETLPALGAILKAQQGMVAGPGTPAAQADLARQLQALDSQIQRRPPSVPDALKPQLAQVSRMAMVQGALGNQALGLWDALGKHARPHLFSFAATAEPIAAPDVADSLPQPEGTGTYLGSSIRQAVDRFAGARLAGVVVFTDGAGNGGLDPLSVADDLALREVPLFLVGVGLPGPDDLAMHGLVVQDVLFGGDLVPVRVQVRSNGYENRATVLTVSLDGREVARKPVILSGRDQLVEVSFEAPKTPGPRTLEVAVLPLADEATLENNALQRTIRVVDQKIRLEGGPRWEYRYLRAILKRDPRIEAQFLTTEGDLEMARASEEHIARFPDEPGEAFAYDLVVLGDVQATTFTPVQLDLLHQLVHDRGGSLILLAGPKHAPAEYVDTPIAEMLPIWIQQDQWEEVGKDVYPELTTQGQASSVMQLADSEARNRALWANCKPLNRVAAPLTGAKGGAVVLATLSDSARRSEPVPLIAWHRYGTGKVMFLGTDRLWRLRQKVGDRYHRRFWSQAVQFLALSRLLGENSRVRFEVEPRLAMVAQPIEIFANVLNETYEPEHTPTVTAEVTVDGQATPQSLSLRAVPGTAGFYHALFTPSRPGRYRVSASDTGELISNIAEFEVETGSQERFDPAMHQDLLRQMARRSGGAYLRIADLPRLAQLTERPGTVRLVRKQMELWDHWVVAVAFLALAATEWAWRRRRDLA